MAQIDAGPAHEVTAWTGPLGHFSVPDTNGQTWGPERWAGRAVLLNFWATWCEPCRAEMPSMQRLAERYGPDRLVVLAINFKESPGRVIRFTQSSGFTLPVLLDADGQLAGRWGVKIFPTTLLLDSQGLPQRRVKGEVDWMSPASFRLIDALLADSRPASKITLTQR